MSNEHVLKTIEMVQAQVRELEQQTLEKKRVANDLCKLADRPPCYADTQGTSAVTTSIRADEFYGKPLATAVRSILEKRAAANLGAATVSELYESLVIGGMAFEVKNDANAKRGLYSSLSKNQAFHKLPNGTYGLSEWYPNKPKKEANGSDGKTTTTDEMFTDEAGEPDEELVEAAAQDEPEASAPRKPK
jgi:hypothetical protein